MWYKSGLQFECAKCGDCCRGEPGVVWIRDDDISRIAESLGMSRNDFTKQYTRKIGTRISLKEKPGGDCILWNDRCLAYEVRPPQCRSFPFWRDNLSTPGEWEETGERCPGINSGALHQAPGMGTSDAFAELEEVYDQIARELVGLDLSCKSCGECCHLAQTGHELFATKLEVYYIVKNAGMPTNDIDNAVCPYLDGNSCSVHPYRTLGCRLYFCDDKAKPFYQSLYEKYRTQIGNIAAAYYLPTDYAKATDILKELHT